MRTFLYADSSCSKVPVMVTERIWVNMSTLVSLLTRNRYGPTPGTCGGGYAE